MDYRPIVLLVDDDENDSFLLQRVFVSKVSRFQLVLLHDGDDCLSWLEKEEQMPALIMLDLYMPTLNGFELLTKLRSMPRFDVIPVLALSRAQDPETVRKAYTCGANAFFNKPDSYRELLDMVIMVNQFWLSMAYLPSVYRSHRL